jgi:hypothetical protein
MSKKPRAIKITMEDVAFIFNDKPDDFYGILSNCFCAHCKNKYQSTITNYELFLNHLYDIEVKGSCLECNNSIGRYIETGDNPETAANAESIWKTNKTLKELKIKKKKL